MNERKKSTKYDFIFLANHVCIVICDYYVTFLSTTKVNDMLSCVNNFYYFIILCNLEINFRVVNLCVHNCDTWQIHNFLIFILK